MLYLDELKKLGLSDKEAEIYLILSEATELKGSEIDKKSKYSRQTVYSTLENLIKLNLVEKNEKKGQVAKFKITHPSKLQNLLNKKEEEFKQTKNSLTLVIKNLISDFNLISGQPGVQVFEGEEGVRKVLNDSLKTKGEILTYADVEPVIKYIKNINDEYVKKRLKLKIKKRALVLDTEFARKYMKENYSGKITDTRFLNNGEIMPFSAFVEIYDDKISYITFENDNLIGIIIQNKPIADINKYLFEFA